MTDQNIRPGNTDPSTGSGQTLRHQAEAIARKNATQFPESFDALSPEAQALQELRVHQIELEMQNEELRHAQVELDAVRERYFDLYDLAPVGYCTLSERGLILQANLSAATLLGVARSGLVRQPISRFIFKADQDSYYLHCKQIVETGEAQSCELRMVKNDGTHFWAHLQAGAAQGDDGAPVLRIVLSEITERKQAEEELRIAAIAFESQSGMIITDTNGVILRVNRAFTTLTGYSEKEALGQTPQMLSSGRHDQAFFQAMWGELKEGYWQGEVWNRRKNGTIYAEWLSISAVTAPDGSVTHYVGTFSDITENQDAVAEIHRLAYYDPLTRLPNRRLLQDRLRQALAAATRSRLYGAIMFLDMDNFKKLNDTRGHDAGDQLLIVVAQRLHACIREGDIVARLGGDEFVLLLEGLSAEAEVAAALVEQVGEKVLGVLAQPYNFDGYEFHCTASIGIGLYCERETAEELLKHADLAMYQAKTAGRNSLCFFDPAMQAVVTARAAMEKDLRRALAENQFRLYFQAQVDHNRQIVGAEALLRWQHPERGLVSPVEFITLAEETGLMLPIGQWALETACAQLKAWAGTPHARNLQLAVNVSARRFHQEDFVALVQQALSSNAINPDLLKLELTESLVLDNVDDAIVKMNALVEIGVRFSMDDFGTGNSSLSYLTRLPLHQLKIDQSFVRNIGVKPTDTIVVQTIIGMAHNLGLEVIAEGVETEEQRAFLEQHGCAACQGYLFSEPVPIEEFEELVRRA